MANVIDNNLITLQESKPFNGTVFAFYTIESPINGYAIIVLALCVLFLVLIIAYFVVIITCSKKNLLNKNDNINIYIKDFKDPLEHNEKKIEAQIIVDDKHENITKTEAIKVRSMNNLANLDQEIKSVKSKEFDPTLSATSFDNNQCGFIKVVLEDEISHSKSLNQNSQYSTRIIPKLMKSNSTINYSENRSQSNNYSNNSDSRTDVGYVAIDLKPSHQTTLWTTNSNLDNNSQGLSVNGSRTGGLSHSTLGTSSVITNGNLTLNLKEGENPFENDSIWTTGSKQTTISRNNSLISGANNSVLTAENIKISDNPFENDGNPFEDDISPELNVQKSKISVKKTKSARSTRTNNSQNNSVMTSDNLSINLKDDNQPSVKNSTSILQNSIEKSNSRLTNNSGNLTINLNDNETPFENDSVWTAKSKSTDEISNLKQNEEVSGVLAEVKNKIDTVNERVNILIRALSDNNVELSGILKNPKSSNSTSTSRHELKSKKSGISYSLMNSNIEIGTGDLNELSDDSFRSQRSLDEESSELIKPLVSLPLKRSQTEVNLKELNPKMSYGALSVLTISKSMESLGSTKPKSQNSLNTNFTIQNLKNNLSLENLRKSLEKNSKIEYKGPVINSIKSNQSSNVESSLNQSSLIGDSGSLSSSMSSSSSSKVKEKIKQFEKRDKIIKAMQKTSGSLNNVNNARKYKFENGSVDDLKYKLEKISSSAEY
ncbi:unnamed protein product [Brachionus calyciflorus]|uniref:Uncharacterized protein n=1 Tax=Brachionus calyciflorus TaxID=104777 RepID=A0A813MEM9_9BILA|nr:unnamed protein product [Brachionus calyciflorus]